MEKVLSPNVAVAVETSPDNLVMTSFLLCTCYFHMSNCCKKTAFCDSSTWAISKERSLHTFHLETPQFSETEARPLN